MTINIKNDSTITKGNAMKNLTQNDIDDVSGGDCFCTDHERRVLAANTFPMRKRECRELCCSIEEPGIMWGFGKKFDYVRFQLQDCNGAQNEEVLWKQVNIEGSAFTNV